LAFAAPPLIRSGPLTDIELDIVARSLGIATSDIVDSNWVANGPMFVAVLLRDAAQVLALEPDVGAFGEIEIGVAGLHPAGSDVAVEVRVFFRGGGITEDPITGSFNAGLATWLTGSGVLPPTYVAAQGTVLGRTGRVHIDTDADRTIWVGGDTLTTIVGTVSI
jgi:PhzF family phenazine biosynthesis protein